MSNYPEIDVNCQLALLSFFNRESIVVINATVLKTISYLPELVLQVALMREANLFNDVSILVHIDESVSEYHHLLQAEKNTNLRIVGHLTKSTSHAKRFDLFASSVQRL